MPQFYPILTWLTFGIYEHLLLKLRYSFGLRNGNRDQKKAFFQLQYKLYIWAPIICSHVGSFF